MIFVENWRNKSSKSEKNLKNSKKKYIVHFLHNAFFYFLKSSKYFQWSIIPNIQNINTKLKLFNFFLKKFSFIIIYRFKTTDWIILKYFVYITMYIVIIIRIRKTMNVSLIYRIGRRDIPVHREIVKLVSVRLSWLVMFDRDFL